MIKFNNPSQETPYLLFKSIYTESLKANQKNIEAICISSYSLKNKEVNARFVNLKFVNNKEFIFFSNYNSPKSEDFNIHEQITGLLYWNSINTQIRMKAYIKKTSIALNQEYFAQRSKEKNALAISSSQSDIITSYSSVKEKYEKSLKEDNLIKCPDYWGGFSFTPYYFEFWKGHESRLNQRQVYSLEKNAWVKSYLQP